MKKSKEIIGRKKKLSKEITLFFRIFCLANSPHAFHRKA